MLTQAQAQAHGEQCGMKGQALCLPLPNGGYALRATYRLAHDIVNPENLDVLAHRNTCPTGYVLNALVTQFGIDYCFTM